jgi:hypothetical protein
MTVVPLMKRPQQKRSRISREHSTRTRHPRMVMGVVTSAAFDAEAAAGATRPGVISPIPGAPNVFPCKPLWESRHRAERLATNRVLIQYLRIDARTFPMYALNMYEGELPCPESL